VLFERSSFSRPKVQPSKKAAYLPEKELEQEKKTSKKLQDKDK
jgi:hypothetical protein